MASFLPAKVSQKTIAMLLLGFLASCGHFSDSSLPLPKSYQNDSLPPLKNLNAVISWHEDKNTKPLQFLAFIEFSEKSTTFVTLHSSGMRMFTLIQDHSDNSVDIEKSFFNDSNIHAEQLFKDLLLSYLSANFLQKNLSPSWQVTSNHKQRILLYNNIPTKQIDYADDSKQRASFTALNQDGLLEYRFDISLQEGNFQ